MRRAWLLTTLTGFVLFPACGSDGNSDLFEPNGGASGAGGIQRQCRDRGNDRRQRLAGRRG